MKKIAPEEIPSFAHTVSSAFGLYTDLGYRDSVYVLQDALDIIENQIPDSAKVNTFVWLCNVFNSNRMFNSYEEHTIVEDKMEYCISDDSLLQINHRHDKEQVLTPIFMF